MKPDELVIVKKIVNDGKQLDHEQWIDKNGTKIDFYTLSVVSADNKSEVIFDITAHDDEYVYCNLRGIRPLAELRFDGKEVHVDFL